jgi:nudix-type nucleoside diphosphatase (YffH/AdpP family)
MPKKTSKLSRAPLIKLISSKHIFSGPAFEVYTDVVREGEFTGRRDVVRHTGSVVVMAVKEDKSVLLVRQYRHAAGQYLWELPAGRNDKKETNLRAAQRELLEETGVSAKKWKRILTFYVSPGFLDETMDVFLAEGLTLGKASPEEDEQIDARFVPLRQALQWVNTRKIRDAKTVAGLLWLKTQNR